MERAGASMEKALESFFTAWGTCKLNCLTKKLENFPNDLMVCGFHSSLCKVAVDGTYRRFVGCCRPYRRRYLP